MPIVATDDFSSQSSGLNSAAYKGVALTKSDTDELVKSSRGLYVGVSGDLNVIMAGDVAGGTQVLIKGAAVGYHPLRIRQLMSTSTTATNVIALY